MRNENLHTHGVYYALYRGQLVPVRIERIEYPHILATLLDTRRVVALQSHQIRAVLLTKSA